MAVYQTDYTIDLAAARPGQIANDAICQVDSRIAKNADDMSTAGIGFGLAVTQGAGDKDARLPGEAATELASGFIGITVRDVTTYPEPVNEYHTNSVMGVLTQGDIWVTVGSEVAAGQDVTFAPGGGLSSDAAQEADDETKRLSIAGARWMTSAAPNGLAVVRLGAASMGTVTT